MPEEIERHLRKTVEGEYSDGVNGTRLPATLTISEYKGEKTISFTVECSTTTFPYEAVAEMIKEFEKEEENDRL